MTVEKKDVLVAQSFIQKVNKKYPLKKALLFGSRARGDNLKSSDFDILLVSKKFKDQRMPQRMSEVYKYWNNFPIDVETICLTEEEVELKKKYGLIKQALKEGINLMS